MKYCKECECILPDDYEDDTCPCCIDDRVESEVDK